MPDTQKKPLEIRIAARPRAGSEDSVATRSSLKPPSLKSPRAARFAEATAVNSPIDPPKSNHFMAQPQISDVGFGYVNKHESVEMPDTDNNEFPKTGLKSPLKSAMKTPGAPPKDFGMLSPTFKEEAHLEKREELTEKEQVNDIKVKTRVRIAKFFLRGINFSCSLIVLAMLSSTFMIFRATRALPPRNNLPPWAVGQKIWPQVLLLSIACVSLVMCVGVFYAYWKGGHRRAEKASIYYSAFAVIGFVFSIVMWGIGAGVLQHSKNNSNNKDMWGWSCVDNTRKTLFQNEVDYELICRLQNWSLVCCIIEVVVETLTIAVYGIVFYRFYSKKQLRKSMAVRDRARSDLYLAQLRSQSAPNTPGFGPLSPRDGGYRQPTVDSYVHGPTAENGGHSSNSSDSDVQYISANQHSPPKAFQLQAPPIRVQGATPKMAQVGFTPVTTSVPARQRTPSPPVDQRSPLMAEIPREQMQEHFAAAPGEQVYADVPIPGAYQPLSPTHSGFQH
ncbi:hypothetical protein LTR95_003058 [Oleoguttula sp. CCFEE 5521]